MPLKRNAEKQKTNPRALKRFILCFGPYKFQVVLMLLAIILTTALNLVVPLLIPRVFDIALPQRNMRLLIIYACLMISATALAGIIGVAQTYLSNHVGQYVIRDLRNKLYAHLQDMSLNFFTSTRTGEIHSRMSNDITSAQSAITDTFTPLIVNVVTATGTVISMIYLNTFLTLVSFALLPFFLWMTYKVGNVRRKRGKATQESLAFLNSLVQETLSVSGVILIKTFGRKKYAQRRFEMGNQKVIELGIKQQMVGRWSMMMVNTFFALTPALIYVVAGWLIIYHEGTTHITPGDLFAFITLQSRFFGPMGQLLSLQVEVQGAFALFDRIFEYIDLPIEIRDAPFPINLSTEDVQGKVSFKNVSFTYKQYESGLPNKQNSTNGKKNSRGLSQRESPELIDLPMQETTPKITLDNVSFDIEPGQLVAIVGPSGAGKTTITYLLSRLYDADQGRIEIDRHNIKEIALESLGELIGTVTQETYLFNASIRENFDYVRPGVSEEEIIAATKAAAIHERIMRLSDGYDTVVGERGYRFSGGEKQRMAIARVLLKNPRILILDEATSALDTTSEYLIQAALEPLMKNRTTIAIAHRLSTILAANVILVMENGKIVEKGTHQKLLAQRGLYTKLYNQQFQVNEITLEARQHSDKQSSSPQRKIQALGRIAQVRLVPLNVNYMMSLSSSVEHDGSTHNREREDKVNRN